MHKALKLIGAAALTLFCAEPVWAQTPPNAPAAVARPAVAAARRVTSALENSGPSPFIMLLRSANLNPDQRTQIRQILHSQAEKNRPLFEQLRALREQISGELLGAGTVSAADLAPLEQQVSQIRTQIDRNLIDTSVAIRGVLTPDQVSHLAEVHRRLESLRAQVENLLGAPTAPN